MVGQQMRDELERILERSGRGIVGGETEENHKINQLL
jgi:hypothetical protein